MKWNGKAKRNERLVQLDSCKHFFLQDCIRKSNVEAQNTFSANWKWQRIEHPWMLKAFPKNQIFQRELVLPRTNWPKRSKRLLKTYKGRQYLKKKTTDVEKQSQETHFRINLANFYKRVDHFKCDRIGAVDKQCSGCSVEVSTPVLDSRINGYGFSK